MAKKTAEALHQRLTQLHQIIDEEIMKLADLNINSQQIKNFLKTAQLLTIYKEKPLRHDHVETVIMTTQHLHKATEATSHVLGSIGHLKFIAGLLKQPSRSGLGR